MSITIRAHFDGKVIIPDQPVDLPVNQPIEISLRQMPVQLPWDKEAATQAWDRMKQRALTGLSISDEALRRENLYDDRV